ncbi:MAG: HD domain-containing protein, partial [archaeon]
MSETNKTVEEILENLESFRLVSKLKAIPRSGKAARIDYFKLNLPKRSLYDHVISMIREAEVFAKYEKITKKEFEKVLELICFHDIAETIAGDAPNFTKKSIAGHLFKTKKENKMQVTKANAQLAEMFSGELKDRFSSALALLDKPENKFTKFVRFIDKIDPIIGIWQYIYLFKKEIDIEVFLKAMDDFFTNPKNVFIDEE